MPGPLAPGLVVLAGVIVGLDADGGAGVGFAEVAEDGRHGQLLVAVAGPLVIELLAGVLRVEGAAHPQRVLVAARVNGPTWWGGGFGAQVGKGASEAQVG